MPFRMKVLRRADFFLTKAVDILLLLTFSIMLGLAALQVFLRFFFHTGIVWGDVAARHLVLWVGFFGAYLATREKKHFHIDALTRTFHPRVRLWLGATTNLFAALVCLFLLRASFTFVSVAVDPDSVLLPGLPEKAVAWIVPAGFLLMLVQFLIRIVDDFTEALG
jgi:TRAP-type C4-dicarboxylate transport system permease small subunit